MRSRSIDTDKIIGTVLVHLFLKDDQYYVAICIEVLSDNLYVNDFEWRDCSSPFG